MQYLGIKKLRKNIIITFKLNKEIPSRSERLVECELSVESVKSESVSSDSELVGKIFDVRPEVEATEVEAIYILYVDNNFTKNNK